VQVEHCEPDDGAPYHVREHLRAVRSIDARGFPLRMEMTFRYEASKEHGPAIGAHLVVVVPDRDDVAAGVPLHAAKKNRITFRESTTIPTDLALDVSLRWVRELARRVVLHELDECLLVAGRRHWDPHAGGRDGF
jgi:hypothetical protein